MASQEIVNQTVAEYRRLQSEYEAGRATEEEVTAAFWTYEHARCALIRLMLEEKRAKYGYNPYKPRWVPEISEWV